jgi:alpha-tubulin suppressor-like RCC1 family protein
MMPSMPFGHIFVNIIINVITSDIFPQHIRGVFVCRGCFPEGDNGEISNVGVYTYPAEGPVLPAGRIVRQVACGGAHTLVSTLDGELFAFGRNDYGQLGIGTRDDAQQPTMVKQLEVSCNCNQLSNGHH